MPQNHGYRNNPRKHQKPKVAVIDEQNPILKAFQGYASELDAKHDRNERIVKLCRDITIEAKRIIFLLHTIDGRKNNKTKILEEAETRLNKLIDCNFKGVARELRGYESYQHRWAYSPGLQEFIEAYTFMEYLKNTDADGDHDSGSSVSDWKMLQDKMQYKEEEKKEIKEVENESTTEVSIAADEKLATVSSEPPEIISFFFFVDPTEYILGLSDLTGELMRRCINSLGSGETENCFDTCKVLQQFYTGYISLHVHRCRELSRKIYTMKQSVLKAENVCYNVRVRGGEAAKWGAVFDTKPSDDVDEGFY